MTDHPLAAIGSDQLKAEIDPLGAQLHSLRDGAGRDLLWDGDPKVWSGRAPILFPIVGMLAHGRYRWAGKTYALEKHGFARRRRFSLVAQTPASALFRLQADAETRAVYPFEFQLDLSFVIEAATLTMTARVANVGDGPLYASFGFHPALRWPLPYGEARADHALHFERAEPAPIRRIDKAGVVKPEAFPTPVEGDRLRLRDDLFIDDALIFDRLQSRSLRYGATRGPQLEIAFPDTPYLGVWTKPGAGYICVEPWHGIADPVGFEGQFPGKPGVFQVSPDGEHRAEMLITLLDSASE